MDFTSRIFQLALYGIVSGSIITLGAIGLSLTYGILKFANFAHGDVMATGAFLALIFLNLFQRLALPSSPFHPLSFGLPLVLAFILCMVATGGVAIGIDSALYKRLRGTRSITLLIASVGVAFILRNVLQFIWGPDPRYYIKKIQVSVRLPILGLRIKHDQVFIIIVAACLVIFLHFFLTRTRMGKAMRATSDNMDLAKVSGIDTEKVIKWTWVIGSALAAAGAVLAGIDNKFITPSFGWDMLLPIFAAVILGGIGSPYGAMLGGMVIGLSSEISTAFIATSYKPAVAFIIMVVMLLIKPRGLLGEK
ncbi:branched-chain amino acid ABC transporter permease [Candidatus Aerophobetes bacterium]|nr:branched-chain amino acid ABC transporter permease [Candidatus Aerophobetes bacterium]